MMHLSSLLGVVALIPAAGQIVFPDGAQPQRSRGNRAIRSPGGNGQEQPLKYKAGSFGTVCGQGLEIQNEMECKEAAKDLEIGFSTYDVTDGTIPKGCHASQGFIDGTIGFAWFNKFNAPNVDSTAHESYAPICKRTTTTTTTTAEKKNCKDTHKLCPRATVERCDAHIKVEEACCVTCKKLRGNP